MLALGEHTLVMGILNVTPDSFSDGGKFSSAQQAIEHGLRLLEEGADILDVGGESTRPGSKQVITASEEQDRVLPVIEGLLKHRPAAIISIDTYRSETARAAMAIGAEIVNDVSGFTWDTNMASACAQLQCGCILMHMRGRPETWRTLPPLVMSEVVPMVLNELGQRAAVAMVAGVKREHLVLDPGFGFGKVLEENYPLLAQFEKLHELNFPLLSGTSRKSFVGRMLAQKSADGMLLDAPVEQRLYGTLATVVVSVLKGAHIVRVHDVKPAVEALAVADALQKENARS
jgi:dihydropteroate synthase